MALSGWLGDNIFEPAFLTPEGWGTRLFSNLVGTGPGAGLSLMIAISGIMVSLVGLVGTFSGAIRNVETRLPDYDLPEDHKEPARLEFD
jgi:MFS transporter, DHA3 family, macrolide efflux protein